MRERTTYEVSGCTSVLILLAIGTVAAMAAFYGVLAIIVWVVS